MNVRTYLKEIWDYDKLIKIKKEKIQILWSSAMYSGISYEERVQSSRKLNTKTDTIDRIIILENEIKELQQEIHKRQCEIRKAASELDDVNMVKVIILRYIELKPWDNIAEELSCSRRWVMELHNRALSKISNSLAIHIANIV